MAMTRFAKECLFLFAKVTNKLDVALGPDTSDLALRIGLHSGPVIAGVLRGDRARFQLFGDTMNTCARMESTAESGRIQCSEATANELTLAGKSAWLLRRPELVTAKGKGEMQTFWITTTTAKHTWKDDFTSGTGRQSSVKTLSSSQTAGSGASTLGAATPAEEQRKLAADKAANRRRRLVDWNTETLLRLLKQVVVRRKANRVDREDDLESEEWRLSNNHIFFNEVKEIIHLPEFNSANHQSEKEFTSVQIIDSEVVKELRDYVTCISLLYRDNSFHNFEHARYVRVSLLDAS